MGAQYLSKVKNVMILFLVIGLCLCTLVECKKHVSIKNRLGSGKNLSIHCKSGDDDLGAQNIADGQEYGFSFNVNFFRTTLFFCSLAWEKVPQYHIEAYSYAKDHVRCDSGCSWIVAAEGIYGLNGKTGFWEFMYHWPN
jgi:hypothetical protein